MTAQLNHTIVYSSDRTKSARFLAAILGRPAPVRFGPFEVVELDNGVSLDFTAADGPIQPQHYAFLISEADFDAVFGRIQEQGIQYWADPRLQFAPSAERQTSATAPASEQSDTRARPNCLPLAEAGMLTLVP